MRAAPCTALDIAAGRDMVMTIALVVNVRLDPQRLEDTLWKLIEHKFPRAGGRLVSRNGVYEFQIPDTFDAKTPPAVFTVEDHPEAFHSAGKSRPKIPSLSTASQAPSVVPAPALDPFCRSRTCPKTLDEFLKPNVPLLHVHVAVFNDLTFIGVTSPHIALDAIGTGTLLAAWARVLNGDDIAAIPGMEWDAQPFTSYAPESSSGSDVRVMRGWFELGWLYQLFFIVVFILRLIRDPKEVSYCVRVPKVFLEDQKQKIMEDLKLRGSSEYVGSSDVLIAWWFKTIYSHRAVSNTPVHLHLANDLRGLPLFANDAPLAAPYINNAAMTIPVPPISVNAFRNESVGEIALRIRRAILAYNANLASARAHLRWLFTGSNASKTLFPCPPGAEFAIHTSLRSAKLGKLDFSGALVGDGKGADPRVVFVHGMATSKNAMPGRGVGVVHMEDEDAVWMVHTIGGKDGERIRQSGELVFSE
ncbi:hypothetical protein C8R45DRAFT_901486 [Mycena sanguinolenta]|nr:hypothetical protein C8R45DRAFT_901486 [Mycena sanguinolenta]